MIARREFVLGAAAGALMQRVSAYAKASQPATNVNFDVPAGACDCHTHIHGDPAKFPWFAGRHLYAEMALPEEMTALHKALKIQRVVIVTPSVYGRTIPRRSMAWRRAERTRADVAVIDDKTTDADWTARGAWLQGHPPQSFDRRHQRSQGRDRALPRRAARMKSRVGISSSTRHCR